MSEPKALWITWLISSILLLVVGGALFLVPEIAQQYWPWQLAPFNTRLLGVVYLSAAIPLIGYVTRPRPDSLYFVLPLFACFTTYFLLVSMGHSSSFHARKSSHIWFFLYGADSFVGLLYCWRLRQHLQKQPSPPHHFMSLCQTQALILGLYGLGLLFAAPFFGQQLWPWPLDLFHSHLYSGVFFSGALGLWLLGARATGWGRFWLGMTQAVLGLSIVLGNWWVDQQVRKLDWSNFSPWLWQLVFLAFGCLGAWVALQAQFSSASSTAGD